LSQVRKYKNVDEMIGSISKDAFDGTFVLIKGSRGIKLEKLLDVLK